VIFATGLEPAASCVTGGRSKQLNYDSACKTDFSVITALVAGARLAGRLLSAFPYDSLDDASTWRARAVVSSTSTH
jgi:hypothetical protein